MKKYLILAAGFTGYVLGAKAGRQRYEQIMDSFAKLKGEHTQERIDPTYPSPVPPVSPATTTLEDE